MWKKIMLVLVVSAIVLTGTAGTIYAGVKNADNSLLNSECSDCNRYDYDWNYNHNGQHANLIAGGDKVRGELAEGPANQLGECPFTG